MTIKPICAGVYQGQQQHASRHGGGLRHARGSRRTPGHTHADVNALRCCTRSHVPGSINPSWRPSAVNNNDWHIRKDIYIWIPAKIYLFPLIISIFVNSSSADQKFFTTPLRPCVSGSCSRRRHSSAVIARDIVTPAGSKWRNARRRSCARDDRMSSRNSVLATGEC